MPPDKVLVVIQTLRVILRDDLRRAMEEPGVAVSGNKGTALLFREAQLGLLGGRKGEAWDSLHRLSAVETLLSA